LDALKNDRIDFVSSDHSPHLISEKDLSYEKSKSGAPIIQFGLLGLLEFYHDRILPIEMIVKKTSHDVAKTFQIKDRGFIREGYFADLVLIDMKSIFTVEKNIIMSKCGWSPLEGKNFRSTIFLTMVNGNIVFKDNFIVSNEKGMRIQFDTKH
jgi:dihydroorotase